jgi:hypothetical protein
MRKGECWHGTKTATVPAPDHYGKGWVVDVAESCYTCAQEREQGRGPIPYKPVSASASEPDDRRGGQPG